MPRIHIAFFIAFCAAGASAQEAYPSKPLTMVVPFPPGGVADIVGRPLAAGMHHALKQPVVVVNRTGAGGAVGMASVADRKSTRLNSSHRCISYAVFCLKK